MSAVYAQWTTQSRTAKIYHLKFVHAGYSAVALNNQTETYIDGMHHYEHQQNLTEHKHNHNDV